MSLAQHFEKEIYQYVNINLQKRTHFLRRSPSVCFLQENTEHLCWSLFLILSNVKFLKAPTLKNICVRLFMKMCSWNWEKLTFLESFSFTLKTGFFNINIRNKWKCLFLFHDWFPMKFVFTYNISLVWWEINFKH